MAETYSLADVQRMTAAPASAPAAAAKPETFTLEQVQAMSAPAPKRAGLGVPGPASIVDLVMHLSTPEGRANVGNAVAGSIRGAGSLGATLLDGLRDTGDAISQVAPAHMRLSHPGTPAPIAPRGEELRTSMDGALAELGADPSSIPFQAGRVTTEVAGTLGAGGALAAPIRAVAGASKPLNVLANLLETAGMRSGTGVTRASPVLARAGDLAARSAGGAVTGAASTALIDPQNAGSGAAIGAVLPPGIAAAGAAGRNARNALVAAATPANAKAAVQVAEIAGADPTNLNALAEVAQALRQQGPRIIPGQPTVPEILQAPGVSQLQRTVKAVQPGAFTARDAERELARREVLERIAPVGNVREVAQEVGDNITGHAIPAERAARERVSALFDAIPSDQAVMQLPLQRMQDAQTRFVGPGSFGKGEATIEQAMRTATNIGMDEATMQARAVPFNQIQALRSSIGEAINEAKKFGRAQAAAALTSMKNAIDDKVAEVAAGTRQAGEVFTPEAIDAWGQALNAHATKKAQFNTGPQAGLFRQGGDGLPLAQGAEVPRRFFNANASQVSDAQSFRRLVQDDPHLMNDLRRFAVSDAAGQVDRMGNLTSAKFNKWFEQRAGATGEIFTDQQRAWLKAIADDLRRADLAESLGRSTGSDTVQKAASALNLGLIDSPAVRYAAGKVPGGNALADFVARQGQAARTNRLSALLVDPLATAEGLDTFIASRRPGHVNKLLQLVDSGPLYRAAPVLLTSGD